MKKYILIAGANGAGKSTLYRTFRNIFDMPRVNIDEIVKSFGDWRNSGDVIKAGKIAVKQIENNFHNGVTFNQETTLCGHDIIRNIKRAKELGYYVEIHYVGVASVDIAKQRVAHRVSEGGHGISETDIERRYIESFKRLKEVVKMVDMVILYDNTESFNRFAVYKNGEIYSMAVPFPIWYVEAMGT